MRVPNLTWPIDLYAAVPRLDAIDENAAFIDWVDDDRRASNDDHRGELGSFPMSAIEARPVLTASWP